MENTIKSNLRKFAIYFMIWTVFGIFSFTQGLAQKSFTRDPTPSWHYLVSWLTGVYLWALLTPVILWIGRRFPIERRYRLRRIALHLLLAMILTIVQLVCESAILSRV